MKIIVVIIGLLCLGCKTTGKSDYTMEELCGTYSLVPQKENSVEELVSADPATGWNYNDPQDIDFYLNPDSTFEMNIRYGDFEGPSYCGKWRVIEDTIFLFNMDHVLPTGLSTPEYTNDMSGLINTLVVKPNHDLQAAIVTDIDKDRILRRTEAGMFE